MASSNAVISPSVDHESGVLRYYTSQLMLRFISSDDYDPDGASFAAFGSTETAPFLSIYEGSSGTAAALLLRTPPIVVLPSGGGNDVRVTRGVFTVLPAQGFVKDPGQPVYYNDPIELMDQTGRLLGITSRSPYAGHLAADGHNGALVFILERHTSRLQAINCKFHVHEQRMRTVSSSSSTAASSQSQGSSTTEDVQQCVRRMTRQHSARSSLIEVCGGERLRIPGLIRIAKNKFPGGCIVQHQYFTDSSNGNRSTLVDDDHGYLTCEVVLTSQGQPPSVFPRPPPKLLKNGVSHIADRTATGDFVGVLYSGVLHRRADHTKFWKKRFFVLTQVALHRFDDTETLETTKNLKPRGVIYLNDCRAVRYERFSRPHEFEIELHNGKVFAMHAVDALTCANWASMLSRAIESPLWVHAERAYLTVWRSDHQFDSPRCPKITKVLLRRDANKTCEASATATVISENPQWSEKLSLGSITAQGSVMIQLADGSIFRLSLEDLTRSLSQPCWIAVSTSLGVGRIQSLDDGEDDVPDNLTSEMPLRKSELSDDSSRFLIRLKFRADLQLDKRLTQRRSLDEDRKQLALAVVSALMVLPALGYGHLHSIDQVMRVGCLVSSVAIGAGMIMLAPVAWHIYRWLKYYETMEAELHWFLTLLALEVRPHAEESDRSSSSSGEAPREGRIKSVVANGADDHDQVEEGALLVPTRPLFHGDQLLPTSQAIRTFRLENALDSILARPQFSFFPIQKYFPTRFLPRDANGRRVLLVSLNAVDMGRLTARNLTGFNVARYFLYLWEFIWSYQDANEGVARSEIEVIMDCSGWQYFTWFSIDSQLMLHVLNLTHRFYPGRLKKLIIIRDKSSFGLCGRLLARYLDPALRAITEIQPSLAPYVTGEVLSNLSKDEMALREFVTNLLAMYANVTIPSFTRRELQQANWIARTGSWESEEISGPSSRIGTRAVLLPDGLTTFNWKLVLENDVCTVFRSEEPIPAPLEKGESYQSDARVGQWRGRIKMTAASAVAVHQHLQDLSMGQLWAKDQDEDELVVLDKLSRQEDVGFWSRRVPFMNFSLSGHRGDLRQEDKQANAFFQCVVRRVYDVKQSVRPRDRVYTTMWKTTSAQRVVLNSPSLLSKQENNIQWRKLEDPLVSLCFVVEEDEDHQVSLSFWFQSLSPPATSQQNSEIAKLLAAKFRSLDALAVASEAR